jgi:hypothetical protein
MYCNALELSPLRHLVCVSARLTTGRVAWTAPIPIPAMNFAIVQCHQTVDTDSTVTDCGQEIRPNPCINDRRVTYDQQQEEESVHGNLSTEPIRNPLNAELTDHLSRALNSPKGETGKVKHTTRRDTPEKSSPSRHMRRRDNVLSLDKLSELLLEACVGDDTSGEGVLISIGGGTETGDRADQYCLSEDPGGLGDGQRVEFGLELNVGVLLSDILNAKILHLFLVQLVHRGVGHYNLIVALLRHS